MDWIDRNFVRSLTIPEKVSGPSDGDTGRSPQLVSRSASVGTGELCLIGIGAQPVSEAFNALRGTAWMKEPCASCPRRELDFGGCRCQAFALTGNPTATDPVCHLAPDHAQVAELAAVRTDAPYVYRRMRARSSGVDNGTNRRQGAQEVPQAL